MRAKHTLNFGLDIVDGIRRLHLEGDSLTREGLDEDLHGGLRFWKSVSAPAAMVNKMAIELCAVASTQLHSLEQNDIQMNSGRNGRNARDVLT